MTRSARGTPDNPGSRVGQKAGLNRSILAQGWHGIRRKLTYKCQRQDSTLVTVAARNTSVTCSKRGALDPNSRKSQERFICTNCGCEMNADLNAAENIRRQGLKALGREDGSPARAAGAHNRHQARYPLPAPAAGRERCTQELEEAQATRLS